MQSLPGFRDFLPEDCARRNYILDVWRDVAKRYGFVEYDGPVMEGYDLYVHKNESGAEILQQLYHFQDKGEREVALRPEMTPTLVRMVAAAEKRYRKPLKWFSIATFFRYERQQKGRLREFIQLNCDLIGDGSASADSEILALVIDVMRAFGFSASDFCIRVSDRRAWIRFLENHDVPPLHMEGILLVADKMEREPEASLNPRLKPYNLTVAKLRAFVAGGSPEFFENVLRDLHSRGLSDYVSVDLSIVRGLAYYTGLVFEVFDRSKAMRALAGGGRYDQLIRDLSDGSADLPALGFGMGDVVLGNFIESTPAARAAMERSLAASPACEVYVVVADEERRPQAQNVVQKLREARWRTDFPLGTVKVAKQFQAAEQAGARFAVLVGNEWPQVKVKALASREETSIPNSELADWLRNRDELAAGSRCRLAGGY